MLKLVFATLLLVGLAAALPFPKIEFPDWTSIDENNIFSGVKLEVNQVKCLFEKDWIQCRIQKPDGLYEEQGCSASYTGSFADKAKKFAPAVFAVKKKSLEADDLKQVAFDIYPKVNGEWKNPKSKPADGQSSKAKKSPFKLFADKNSKAADYKGIVVTDNACFGDLANIVSNTNANTDVITCEDKQFVVSALIYTSLAGLQGQ